MPQWLTVLAWLSLAVAFVSAAVIAADIYVRGHRLKMPVMEAVWPVTALYFGPVGLWGYWRFGRPTSRRWLERRGRKHPPEKPEWATVAVGVSHCGAGCTLGDIVAETLVFVLGFSIAGASLWSEYIGDYILAVALGLAFQYFAIAPMRGLGMREGIIAAAKADVLSLTAFEVGLFGWMALMSFVFFPGPHLHPDSPVYWFLMQIGMVIGFATAWPANVWLIRRGVKEAM
ncbi:membrane protein [Sinomonas humi]|uniref:Membrane protein n=1 Tax=Sinomonas humi TaxID=1338436 RepID=A0A0B2ALJ2_9MICC|nr:membrane protein [Sinomonas humi]